MPPRKAAGQAVDEYQVLAEPSEALAAAAAAEAPEPRTEEPKLDLKKPYGMIWFKGLKAYLQSGVIFDRGSKLPIGKV